MARDLAVAARSAAMLVVAYRPLLRELGDGAADRVRQELGLEGWQVVSGLWRALPHAPEPAGEAGVDELGRQLLLALEEDTELADRLAALLRVTEDVLGCGKVKRIRPTAR